MNRYGGIGRKVKGSKS